MVHLVFYGSEKSETDSVQLKAFCNTHDGDNYMSEEEMKEWEDGGDPCQLVMKVFI